MNNATQETRETYYAVYALNKAGTGYEIDCWSKDKTWASLLIERKDMLIRDAFVLEYKMTETALQTLEIE